MSNSKAERSARHAPCVIKTDSTLSDLLDSPGMRRRFQSAPRDEQAAATRASIDGGVSAPVQQKAREPKRTRSEQKVWAWGPPPWRM
jgi:hypothetical protein